MARGLGWFCSLSLLGFLLSFARSSSPCYRIRTGGSNPERRQGEATREGASRQGKQAGNYNNVKITVLPLRLTFDISKINKLCSLVTSSYDVQNLGFSVETCSFGHISTGISLRRFRILGCV